MTPESEPGEDRETAALAGDGGAAASDGWAVPGLRMGSGAAGGAGGLLDAKRAALAELVASWGPEDKLAGIGLLAELAIPELVDPARANQAGRAEQLGQASELLKTAHRLEHVAGQLAVQADQHHTASGGLGATTWLMRHNLLTRAQAAKIVLRGKDLVKFPELRRAAFAGRANAFQTSSAVRVLKQLPAADLDPGQMASAGALMVSFTSELDSMGLARAGRFLLEKVAPELTQAKDQERAEREYRAAFANRWLWFIDHGDGSTTLQASMPTLDAELVRRVVDAHAEQLKRSKAETDPGADRAALRVDGLLAVFDQAARSASAPKLGADRPRVQITMAYEDLMGQAVAAKLVGSEATVPAGQLRRILCDAEVMPVVLGTKSQVLDVGRANRLVTGPIRAALELRDGGCVFGSCDTPVGLAEAHHVKPWASGGNTCLDNLVLLCKHHHALIEPSGHGPPDWAVRFRHDGLPELIPPAALDPGRKPILHQRFILRGAQASPPARPAEPAEPARPAEPADPAEPPEPPGSDETASPGE